MNKAERARLATAERLLLDLVLRIDSEIPFALRKPGGGTIDGYGDEICSLLRSEEYGAAYVYVTNGPPRKSPKIAQRITDADIDREGNYIGTLNLVGKRTRGERTLGLVHIRVGDPVDLMAACGCGAGRRPGWGAMEYFGDRRPYICVKCRRILKQEGGAR